jgi:hypothetical protein
MAAFFLMNYLRRNMETVQHRKAGYAFQKFELFQD